MRGTIGDANTGDGGGACSSNGTGGACSSSGTGGVCSSGGTGGIYGNTGDGGGILYIVATPIGNAQDVTDRARGVLASVDLIAAEDTRSANALLKSLGIDNKTISYHKFNEKYRIDHIISALGRGENVAVISDAGTPCVSDPGSIIVREAASHGFRVTPVCGASAATAALSVCGFTFDSYAFFGFLPRKHGEFGKLLSEMKTIARQREKIAFVFYESPKRIINSINVFADSAPGSVLCLCNDLTKTYEKIYRGAPACVLDELRANPSVEKGEYTLVVMLVNPGGGCGAGDINSIAIKSSPEAELVDYMKKNKCNIKDAITGLIKYGTNYSHKTLYAASLNLKRAFQNEYDE